MDLPLSRRLKPNHLRLIQKILETGKLQIAAEAMAMSQPAASRVLADIESQVGAALFLRDPKGMTPTEIGQAFLRHARSITTQMDSLIQELDWLKLGEAGTVRVGAVTGPAVGGLIPAVRKVRSEAPSLRVTIEVGPSSELIRGLTEGRFDFVLGRIAETDETSNLLITPARSEKVALVVRGSHPLAGRRRIPMVDLLNEEWVIQERGSPIRAAVEKAFYMQSLPAPDNVINSSSLLVALAMLAESDVIAPLTEEVSLMLGKSGLLANLVKLHVETEIQVSTYYAIRKRTQQLSSAADRLLQETLAHL
jgi:DNA-binding transcriptional LysR family regulator